MMKNNILWGLVIILLSSTGIANTTDWSRESEFLIDTSAIYLPALDIQVFPAIASDGINSLVVWSDTRANGLADIYGARVDQSGKTLDPAGILISTMEGHQFSPSIAFDGNNYLIVWYGYDSDYNVYGISVSQAGNVIDTLEIPISTGQEDQLRPSIAFDGTNYLVVWEDYRSGSTYDIYGARVDQAGNILDTLGIPISTGQEDQLRPSIAFDGTNYLVVWEDYRSGSTYDIYGARIDQAGNVLDTTGIIISSETNDQMEPSINFDGTDYLVVWQDGRNGFNYDIYATFVDQAGNILNPAGIAISTGLYLQCDPMIAFDNTNYLVAWHDRRSGSGEIYGTRVDPLGNVLDSLGIIISTSAFDGWPPAVTYDGLNYLAVWNGSPGDIHGARVDQAGNVLDTTRLEITTQANRQRYPSITFDGTNYLVVWSDDCNDRPWHDICGTLLDQSGNMLDSIALRISCKQFDQLHPSVSFDGTNYLVVWSDWRSGSTYDIYCARVDQSGNVLDTAGIAISSAINNQGAPASASDGVNSLVVWHDFRSDTVGDIYGARVDQAGNVLDTAGIPISTEIYHQQGPSISFDGTNYLVAWSDGRSGSWPDIYGARIDQSGNVLDPAGIVISSATNRQGAPASASDGVNSLVVWHDYRTAGSNMYDIYGARVNQAGVVLDTTGIAICTAIRYQVVPSITFLNANYFVVWQDLRSGVDRDIYGAKLDTSGLVVDSFTVSAQFNHEDLPVITHGENNQLLICYMGWAGVVDSVPYNVTRIWGRFYPFVGIEERTNWGDTPTQPSMYVYPNPAKTLFTVNSSISVKSVKIYNVLGRLIKEENLTEFTHEIQIPLTGMNSGVYFVKIETKDTEFIKKLIVTKEITVIM